jgi:ribosomal-protein-alanine N-acetyltransferase
MMISMRTARLELLAMSLAHIEAELAVPPAIAPLLGATVSPSWPPGEFDRAALEYFGQQLRQEGAGHLGWYAWYGIKLDAGGGREALVAAAGYFGPPADGTVEIGYSVIPEARGRGYGAEFVEALLYRAFAAPEVTRVIARTSDSNIPSTRLLLHRGFRRVGAAAEAGMVLYQKERPPLGQA